VSYTAIDNSIVVDVPFVYDVGETMPAACRAAPPIAKSFTDQQLITAETGDPVELKELDK
jgi:hypothetical protein